MDCRMSRGCRLSGAYQRWVTWGKGGKWAARKRVKACLLERGQLQEEFVGMLNYRNLAPTLLSRIGVYRRASIWLGFSKLLYEVAGRWIKACGVGLGQRAAIRRRDCGRSRTGSLTDGGRRTSSNRETSGPSQDTDVVADAANCLSRT